MKKLFIFLLIISCFSCATQKIYIVRHAEKQTVPANDPELTTAGRQRANTLRDTLSNKNIKQTYSTSLLRTRQTAEPTTTLIGVPNIIYRNDTTKTLFKNIFLSKKNTLVVGHSNTILPMLDSMQIAHPTKTTVPDWEYDNLIIITVKKYCATCPNPFEISKVEFKKYGVVSVQ